MGVRISWLMLARKRALRAGSRSRRPRLGRLQRAVRGFQSGRIFAEVLFGPLAVDDALPAVHQQLELAQVAFVVVRVLVADAGDRPRSAGRSKTGTFMCRVMGTWPSGVPRLCGLRRRVVVGDDRPAAAAPPRPKGPVALQSR